MRIRNNIIAANSHRHVAMNIENIARNVERLSSGFRINRSADNPAGLAISEKMRTQIRGLNQAARNAQDGISLVQTAEGAMQVAHSIMQRMRELAVQSANGTNDQGVDRVALDLEFQQLREELIDIESSVKFNGMALFGQNFTLQTGANASDTLSFSVGTLATVTGDIRSQESASIAMDELYEHINNLSRSRAELGAIQNRLEFKIQNLNNTAENLQAAESRIRDVDIAEEMAEFVRNNILFQASMAMLSQANSLPQGVLQLLG